MLKTIVYVGGESKSFASGSKMIKATLEHDVAARQINHLTNLVGTELKADLDKQTQRWKDRLLTQPKTIAEPIPQLACIETDGGRIQTRTPGQGTGVHAPHWRENKNAGFYRMATKTFTEDPCTNLPSCFSSRKNMSQLLSGIPELALEQEPENERPDLSWRPQKLFRSCLSSLASSDEFGNMMAGEADRRGFFTAQRRAFLGDGLPYNWSIHRDHFPTFTPILDFVHAIEHIYDLSKTLQSDAEEAWNQYVDWIELVWQGQVEELIGILTSRKIAIGQPPEDVDETDPRKKLADTLRYLQNNSERMNYPDCRIKGLPTTSCLIESQVKEVNHRTKGTEKFWNDNQDGEAILQVRAAIISDDERLSKHLQKRNGSPYDRIMIKQKH